MAKNDGIETLEAVKMIKVCINPQCDAVFHNCNKSDTRCNDCGGILVRISDKTYQRNFKWIYCQYDYQTMEYFSPEIKLQSELNF